MADTQRVNGQACRRRLVRRFGAHATTIKTERDSSDVNITSDACGTSIPAVPEFGAIATKYVDCEFAFSAIR